jgi:hypothetical protein
LKEINYQQHTGANRQTDRLRKYEVVNKAAEFYGCQKNRDEGIKDKGVK